MNKNIKNLLDGKLSIIFLDIDGVLNHENWYEKITENGHPYTGSRDIDPDCVKNLNLIINSVKNCKIVLSTSWRSDYDDTCEKLYEKGLVQGSIIGKTKSLELHNIGMGLVRGNEIKAFLDELVESVESFKTYVILDDDCDMLLCQQHNFMKISRWTGFTNRNARRAVNILSKETLPV